jgi:hypothetical protein
MAEWRAALSAAGPRGAPVTAGRQIRVLGVVLVLAAIILFWLLH